MQVVARFNNDRPDYFTVPNIHTVKPVYNDLGLCTSRIYCLYIQWHQLISHKARVFLSCLQRHSYCI